MIGDRQLTELLLSRELLDRDGLQEALRIQKRHGGDLYSIVIENCLVDEERTVTYVAKQLNIPCVSLKDFQGTADVIDLLSAELATRYKVIPLGLTRDQRSLYLAMANPIDVMAMEEVSTATGCDVMAFLAGPLDIGQALERCYGRLIYDNRSLMSSVFNAQPDDLAKLMSVAREDARSDIMSYAPSVDGLSDFLESSNELASVLNRPPSSPPEHDPRNDTLELLLNNLKGLDPLPLNEADDMVQISQEINIEELSPFAEAPSFEGSALIEEEFVEDSLDEPVSRRRQLTTSSAEHRGNTTQLFGAGRPGAVMDDSGDINLRQHGGLIQGDIPLEEAIEIDIDVPDIDLEIDAEIELGSADLVDEHLVGDYFAGNEPPSGPELEIIEEPSEEPLHIDLGESFDLADEVELAKGIGLSENVDLFSIAEPSSGNFAIAEDEVGQLPPPVPPPPPLQKARSSQSANTLLYLEKMRRQKSQEPKSSRVVPAFGNFPSELSEAAIRLLAQPEHETLPPAIRGASTRDLVFATLQVLFDRNIISQPELLAELARIQTANSGDEE